VDASRDRPAQIQSLRFSGLTFSHSFRSIERTMSLRKNQSHHLQAVPANGGAAF
jgi:hypothetical protein